MKKNKSPICISEDNLQLNYEEFVEFLLKNKKIDINSQNELGESALHLCCKYGLADKFYTLIYMGANYELTTLQGDTILHYAALHSQDLALTQEIAKKYISPDVLNHAQQTPSDVCTSERDTIFFNNWNLLHHRNKKETIATLEKSDKAVINKVIKNNNNPTTPSLFLSLLS